MPIDYKKYPDNWLSEIRPRIMKRAENKCEFCGLKHGQVIYRVKAWVKIVSKYVYKSLWFSNENDADREWDALCSSDPVRPVEVVLTIAHLDHDETNKNIKDDRLKALCQICHLRYDAKEKFRRSLNFNN